MMSKSLPQPTLLPAQPLILSYARGLPPESAQPPRFGAVALGLSLFAFAVTTFLHFKGELYFHYSIYYLTYTSTLHRAQLGAALAFLLALLGLFQSRGRRMALYSLGLSLIVELLALQMLCA